MSVIKRWAEANAPQVGFAVLQSLLFLSERKEAETLVDLDGRWIKIVCDPATQRLVIFETEPPERRAA